jgi:hypothetical protein
MVTGPATGGGGTTRIASSGIDELVSNEAVNTGTAGWISGRIQE